MTGGRPVHRFLAERRTGLVAATVELIVTAVPGYRQLPGEQIEGDVTRITDYVVRSFIRSLRERAVPGPGELDAIRESAVRRAEEGVPAETVLAAYQLGTQHCWDVLTAAAGPGDLPDLMEISRILLLHMVRVQGEVCAGYVEGFESRSAGRQAEGQALMEALLEGRPSDQLAERAGLVPSPGYLALCLSVPANDDETDPGVNPLIAARRKLRRVRAALDRVTGGTALSQLAATGGLVLLPRPAGRADRTGQDLTDADDADAERVREATSASAGVPTTVAMAACDTAGVPAAVQLTRDILDVVRLTGAPAGLYRLDDVLLEYQLTRPSPANARLAGQLRPLHDKPDLLATLRAYLDTGHDRRATAARLYVHPNTVDYRLRKIAALTGLDPNTPADVPRLSAALLAHAASSPPPAASPADPATAP
jgi:hypothetical protein